VDSKAIPLFKVYMNESVMEPLRKVLMSGYIGQGPKVDEFEKALVPFVGNPYPLTVNSGTSALHLAMRLANVDHGSEIITTPQTCSATSMPALERGAALVWGDIDPWTGNLDPLDVERKITSKTKAILAVHWGGYPCELDELRAVAAKYGIPLVEDAAHAFGASYKGKPIGSHGDLVCFSFQAIKLVTTLDGGLLTCKTPEHYRRGKLLRWFGIDRETPRADLRCENDIVEYGHKFHLNDVAAVIGLEQLKYVAANLARARENAAFYEAALVGTKGVSLLRYTADRQSAYWLFTIRVRDRDGFQRFMSEKGVMVSRVHVRNDLHTYTKAFRRNLPGVDEFEREQVSIPVGWWVSDEDRVRIVSAIQEWGSR
jgi:dTDP-4-amino-4,6-dideoxygalactose transaminase